MDPILVWPDPAPPDIARVLDMAGLTWEAVDDEAAARDRPWSAGVVSAEADPTAGFALVRALRRGDAALIPLLLCLRGSELAQLADLAESFDDFCVVPAHPSELEARIRHLLTRGPAGYERPPEVIAYGPLELNVQTYQAHLDHRPLDLTYMEYELLKFLASSPGRVFTREALLSQVWGYDYYGGARTVDVHIRRLRAKFGEEHAGLIQTVRSVGYRLGESRWNA